MRVYFNIFDYFSVYTIALAIGIMITNTTKDAITNIRLYFNVFFIVIWPGPKNSGDGTAADGVHAAMDAANAMMIVNAAIFVFPVAKSTAPMLKNSTIVTVLDRKFVKIIAIAIKITMIPNGGKPAIIGWKMFPNHAVMPVASDASGVA